MEVYNSGHGYALTISPPFYRGSPAYKYAEDCVMIRKLLNGFSDRYLLFPEFDENARLHYHGSIWIKDKIKFYKTKYLIDKHIGWSKFDPFKKKYDNIGWLCYCRKHYTDRMDKEFPVIKYGSLRRKKYRKPVQEKPEHRNILSFYDLKHKPAKLKRGSKKRIGLP